MEIERKFLINEVPFDLKKYKKKEMSQGYISTSPVIRIRQSDDDYILTIKSGGLLSREEYEISLAPDEYERLKTKVDGAFIIKTRYIIPLSEFSGINANEAALNIELDIFHGDYEGLKYAEVEFPDTESAVSFTPPYFFGTEVTEDGSFSNASLSQNEDPVSFVEYAHNILKRKS